MTNNLVSELVWNINLLTLRPLRISFHSPVSRLKLFFSLTTLFNSGDMTFPQL